MANVKEKASDQGPLPLLTQKALQCHVETINRRLTRQISHLKHVVGRLLEGLLEAAEANCRDGKDGNESSSNEEEEKEEEEEEEEKKKKKRKRNVSNL